MENALAGNRGLAAPGSRSMQDSTECRPLLSWLREKDFFVDQREDLSKVPR